MCTLEYPSQQYTILCQDLSLLSIFSLWTNISGNLSALEANPYHTFSNSYHVGEMVQRGPVDVLRHKSLGCAYHIAMPRFSSTLPYRCSLLVSWHSLAQAVAHVCVAIGFTATSAGALDCLTDVVRRDVFYMSVCSLAIRVVALI